MLAESNFMTILWYKRCYNELHLNKTVLILLDMTKLSAEQETGF